MIDIGFPKHIRNLKKTLYEKPTARVNASYGFSDFFQLGRGIRLGCILSPNLLDIFSKQTMITALPAFDGTFTLGGRKLTCFTMTSCLLLDRDIC